MKTEPCNNPNHPSRGSTIKVGPIRKPSDIAKIKTLLVDQPRNYCLFVVGINTAYRGCELRIIRLSDVLHIREGDYFEIKEPKTGKIRGVTINGAAAFALNVGIRYHRTGNPDAPLFLSRKGNEAITVSYMCNLVKLWCLLVGIPGRFGSHSLRKTWGYQQRVRHNAPLSKLVKAYGHGSERQTLEYLCIQDQEIQDLYMNEI